MDTITILSDVLLAVYDVVGVVLIVWAVLALRKLTKRRC
jgi:hypothetical protein